jgi:hypothetical protein
MKKTFFLISFAHLVLSGVHHNVNAAAGGGTISSFTDAAKEASGLLFNEFARNPKNPVYELLDAGKLAIDCSITPPKGVNVKWGADYTLHWRLIPSNPVWAIKNEEKINEYTNMSFFVEVNNHKIVRWGKLS